MSLTVRMSLNGGRIVWEGSVDEVTDNNGELSLDKVREIIRASMKGMQPNSVLMETFTYGSAVSEMHADIGWDGAYMKGLYLR